VDSERDKPSQHATSPYLRRPIRSLDEARHATSAGKELPSEQAEERLDNHAFRLMHPQR
jgi:hypothetical protein